MKKKLLCLFLLLHIITSNSQNTVGTTFITEDVYDALILMNQLGEDIEYRINQYIRCICKSTKNFIIPRHGFSHFKQLLQNPGLKEMSGFPSSPIYSVKNLRYTALKITCYA